MSAETQGTKLEAPVSIARTSKGLRLGNLFRRMFDNPVVLKELRGRMRGRQAFILLTFYLTVIAGLIGLIYLIAVGEASYTAWDPGVRQGVGKVIFGAVVLLELLLVSFIAPGLTSGAITTERERQTFDLLRTTLLSARSLVLGKLGSAFTYLFLLILTALPIESIAFLLGGVGIGEMVVSSLMLVVTALFFCTLGIFFSSYMKRTLTATVTSYGVILLSFLLVIIFLMLLSYLQVRASSPTRELILGLLVWAIVCTNPFIAAVMTEIILVEEQSLFLTKNVPWNVATSLPSPWIVYIVFYLLLTGIMIFLSIRRVRRPDR